ncbi:hypothetical protein EJB05_51736, partial [Eragrostis curvula]
MECGGLGVRDLAIQNRCLLLKLLHTLHTRADSSWATWVAEHADIASMQGDLHGDHWDTLRALLPAYQELTAVKLGDGRTCSFWNDSWLPQGRLSEELPALFSHAIKPGASVHAVTTGGLRSHLTPRLSRAAEAELQQATSWLADIQLTAEPDRRCSPLIDDDNRLRTAPIYRMLVAGTDHSCPYAHYVWNNCAPPRVQFFSWLLVQGRIKSRSTLLTKHVVQNDTCELCCDAGVLEDFSNIHLADEQYSYSSGARRRSVSRIDRRWAGIRRRAAGRSRTHVPTDRRRARPRTFLVDSIRISSLFRGRARTNSRLGAMRNTIPRPRRARIWMPGAWQNC